MVSLAPTPCALSASRVPHPLFARACEHVCSSRQGYERCQISAKGSEKYRANLASKVWSRAAFAFILCGKDTAGEADERLGLDLSVERLGVALEASTRLARPRHLACIPSVSRLHLGHLATPALGLGWTWAKARPSPHESVSLRRQAVKLRAPDPACRIGGRCPLHQLVASHLALKSSNRCSLWWQSGLIASQGGGQGQGQGRRTSR